MQYFGLGMVKKFISLGLISAGMVAPVLVAPVLADGPQSGAYACPAGGVKVVNWADPAKTSGFYVLAGEVGSPAVYSHVGALTLQQLVQLGGGLLDHASPSLRVVRQQRGGQQIYFDATRSDLLVPGDVVVVDAVRRASEPASGRGASRAADDGAQIVLLGLQDQPVLVRLATAQANLVQLMTLLGQNRDALGAVQNVFAPGGALKTRQHPFPLPSGSVVVLGQLPQGTPPLASFPPAVSTVIAARAMSGGAPIALYGLPTQQTGAMQPAVTAQRMGRPPAGSEVVQTAGVQFSDALRPIADDGIDMGLGMPAQSPEMPIDPSGTELVNRQLESGSSPTGNMSIRATQVPLSGGNLPSRNASVMPQRATIRSAIKPGHSRMPTPAAVGEPASGDQALRAESSISTEETGLPTDESRLRAETPAPTGPLSISQMLSILATVGGIIGLAFLTSKLTGQPAATPGIGGRRFAPTGNFSGDRFANRQNSIEQFETEQALANVPQHESMTRTAIPAHQQRISHSSVGSPIQHVPLTPESAQTTGPASLLDLLIDGNFEMVEEPISLPANIRFQAPAARPEYRLDRAVTQAHSRASSGPHFHVDRHAGHAMRHEPIAAGASGLGSSSNVQTVRRDLAEHGIESLSILKPAAIERALAQFSAAKSGRTSPRTAGGPHE